MSTQATPAVAAPEIPPNISGGLTLLAKRLLPAKLNVVGAAGKKNGFYFNAWAIAKGLALSAMTAQAIAEEFYRAVQADVQQQFPQQQLVWEILPKALTREQGKAPSTRSDARTASDFEQKVRASEKADAERKAQEQAKKNCQALIEQFAPTDHRRGTLKFELRDSQQKIWRDRIASAKDFVKLEKEIMTEARAIYAKLEKQAERL